MATGTRSRYSYRGVAYYSLPKVGLMGRIGAQCGLLWLITHLPSFLLAPAPARPGADNADEGSCKNEGDSGSCAAEIPSAAKSIEKIKIEIRNEK